MTFIGAQTGDEGKGVRVAYYVKNAVEELNELYGKSTEPRVLTLRWQGGANAGHTVVLNERKYALHQLPCGILIPGTYNLMGEGVYFNPRKASDEIKALRNSGIKIGSKNFGIASNAHVTLDYHIDMDAEDSNGQTGHTSTGSGIKPTAIDKYARTGIRFEEFLDKKEFIEALKIRFPKEMPKGTYKQFADSYSAEREFLSGLSVLQTDVMCRKNFNVLIGEGAQGFQLDVDRGLYPGVTSSNPSIPSFKTDILVGTVKMYESSVGGGRPFVGRMNKNLEDSLRNDWKEFGTTTGKPRSLGWLDIVALKNAIESSGINALVGTCGDRLEQLAKIGEKVKLITAYEIEGKKFDRWDKSFHKRSTLYDAKPVFEEFDAWEKFFDVKKQKLSPNAKKFVDRIQELTGTEFIAHGYGPGIDDILDLESYIKLT